MYQTNNNTMEHSFDNTLETREIGAFMELTDGEITEDYRGLAKLNEVIEKIHENGYCIHIIGNGATFHDKEGVELFPFTDGETFEDGVYKAVLEFVRRF